MPELLATEWDANGEMRSKKHNKALAAMTIRLQKLFIERLHEWTAYAAPSGGYRQKRWDHREWSRLLLGALKHNVRGRRGRLIALRKIVEKLMRMFVS